jgi:type II secretory ATPase GspE/PulE/Tfp pilus assembly ATPase PilB-like protein
LIRRHKLPARFIAGVFTNMEKMANRNFAERRLEQDGRVRLLDFPA